MSSSPYPWLGLDDTTTSTTTITTTNMPLTAAGSQPSPTLTRPLASYVQLIEEAIQSSPTGTMHIKDIYAYIMRRYPYYESATCRWRVGIFVERGDVVT